MASEFLKADIEELKALRAKSTRVRSQTALDAALASASAALADLPPEVSSEATPEASAAAEVAEVNKGANPNRNEGQASKAKPPPPTLTPGAFVSIGTFGFDPGAYDSPWVTLYIDLPGVGSIDKSAVSLECKKDSFDLTVRGLQGKDYRLLKTNLEHDIVPADCKTIVKADKIVVKLKKEKGAYSYESWQSLTSKKDKVAKEKAKADPSGGIMDMMKDMYDSGDDNMKKIIGEAMMKSRSEQNEASATGDPGAGLGSSLSGDLSGGFGGAGSGLGDF